MYLGPAALAEEGIPMIEESRFPSSPLSLHLFLHSFGIHTMDTVPPCTVIHEESNGIAFIICKTNNMMNWYSWYSFRVSDLRSLLAACGDRAGTVQTTDRYRAIAAAMD